MRFVVMRGENSIYEINEMLEANGIPPLGSDSELQ